MSPEIKAQAKAVARDLWHDWKKEVVKYIIAAIGVVAGYNYVVGEIKTASESVAPVYGGVSGVIRNVSIIPQIQKDVSYIDLKTTATSDALSSANFRTDPEGNCTYANEVLAKMYGGSPSDFIGDNWLQFVDELEQARVRARWMHSVDNVSFYQDSYTLVNGKRVMVKARPYKDTRSGEVMFWSGVVTEIKRPEVATVEREEQ